MLQHGDIAKVISHHGHVLQSFESDADLCSVKLSPSGEYLELVEYDVTDTCTIYHLRGGSALGMLVAAKPDDMHPILWSNSSQHGFVTGDVSQCELGPGSWRIVGRMERQLQLTYSACFQTLWSDVAPRKSQHASHRIRTC